MTHGYEHPAPKSDTASTIDYGQHARRQQELVDDGMRAQIHRLMKDLGYSDLVEVLRFIRAKTSSDKRDVRSISGGEGDMAWVGQVEQVENPYRIPAVGMDAYAGSEVSMGQGDTA